MKYIVTSALILISMACEQPKKNAYLAIPEKSTDTTAYFLSANKSIMYQKTPIQYSSSAILAKIADDIYDKSCLYFQPLNAEYPYMGGRMHVFWDEANWVIVFEIITFGFGWSQYVSHLVYFAQGPDVAHLDRNEIAYNFHSFLLSDDANMQEIFIDRVLRADAKSVVIKGKSLSIPDKNLIINHLKSQVSDFYIKDNEVREEMLLFYLVDFYTEDVHMTTTEVQKLLGINLKHSFTLKEWYVDEDFSIYNSDRSGFEHANTLIKQVAEALARKDFSRFSLPKKTNTHWRYWYGKNGGYF